mgnify:CR=1 FL=1|jgi:hypothetical protein|tara:strand:- start:49 stop:315 length:267 start_codon:yes stop_codon:yes gene_type:complete
MAPRKTKPKTSSYKGGLRKWFKEDWRDVKTGKPCGRSGKKDKGRPYPACRPANVASRITKKEAAKKTSSKRVNWSVTASGRKRKKVTA